MSVSTAIAKLATVLQTVNAAPQPPLRRIYTDPAEAVSIAEFPSLVMGLSPSQTHTMRQEALGLARHDYTLALWLFLGIRQTSLGELHSRALPWAEAIMRVLSANITLGYVVDQIGDGGSNMMFTYKVGPIPWGQDNNTPLVYWGLTCQLPVTEKPVMDMGAGS